MSMPAAQLKSSILQLAIEGKLVEQNPADEPVDVTPYEGETPFDVPENWRWVQLSNVCSHISAGGDKPADFVKTKTVTHTVPVIANGETNAGIIGYTQEARVFQNSVTVSGRGTIGYSCVRREPYCPVVRLLVLVPFDYLSVDYLQVVLTALLETGTGTSIQQLTVPMIKPKIIPIPPLAEQKRIVAKIEELLPHIAEYSEAEQNLTAFNEAFLAMMKKSTLQAAVQGKLVEQDEGDPPVDVPTFEGEVPFDVPENWRWCKVEDVSSSYIGLTYKPENVVQSGGSIVLRSSNIQNGKLDLSDIVRVNSNISDRLRVQKNDIVICARNGSKRLVGKSAVVDIDRDDLTFGAFMAICKTNYYSYMALYLQSELFFGQLAEVSGTTTINQLTQKSFNKFLVPLPPLGEQKRIVARVEELLAAMEGKTYEQ